MIYLDNAATSYPKSELVYQKMDEVLRNYSVNAGRGSYKRAKEADYIIRDTRMKIQKLLGVASCENVIFAPSATIAANEVIKGISWQEGDIVFVSPYEHNAVMRTLEEIRVTKQIQIHILPTLKDSFELDITGSLDEIQMNPPKLVCMTQISNVTGYILPISEIGRGAKKAGSLVLVDGAQGFGILPTDLSQGAIDFYLFAGHKSVGGPFGIGGYVNVTDYPLYPFLHGGNGSDSRNLSLPDDGILRYEVGSPDIVAIAGLGAAIDEIQDLEKDCQYEQNLVSYFRDRIFNIDGVVLFPNKIPKQATNYLGMTSFALEGFTAEEVGKILDEEFDIAVRTGYHCAPLVHDRIGSLDYGGTVRVSVGRHSTKSDINALVEALEEIME